MPDVAEVRKAAKRLVRTNSKAEPTVEEIWLFPDEEEIRLIEFNRIVSPDIEIVPFHFPADPANEVAFPIAVAVANPQDRRLSPPEGWGSWENAVRLYSKRSKGNNEVE